MANDKQLSLSDIKGDLAQRLGCAACTRKFNQVKAMRVELDRYETKESNSKKAVTFICEECNKEGRAPVYAYRLVGTGGLVNEIRVEDLPESTNPKVPAPRKSTSKRGKRKGKVTTPTNSPTAAEAVQAAKSIATAVDKE